MQSLCPGRARSVYAVVGMLVCLLLGVQRIAEAHTELRGATPAAGAVLNVVPRAIRLDFTEVPELAFTRIQVIGPGGKGVALGTLGYASDSRRSVVDSIKGPLQPGEYVVDWQTAGDDSHPVRDRYRFTIAVGAMGMAATQETGTLPVDAIHHDTTALPNGLGFGVESSGYVAIRWANFVALLLTIGAVAFRQVVLRIVALRAVSGGASSEALVRNAARRAARFGAWTTTALFAVLLARFVAQIAALKATGNSIDPVLITATLQRTMWGWGWLLQTGATIAAWFGFSRAARSVNSAAASSPAWSLTTAAAILLGITPAFSGHAAAVSGWGPLALLADGAHVLGASGWLGSLALVVIAGIPAAMCLEEDKRGPAIADLINAFSPTALVFAGLVAVTGLFAAWVHVGSLPALWQASYGKLLIAKLAVLSAVALTGAYNWLRVRPTLGQLDGASRIRRSATVELLIGLIVLLITAVLVATPTPMDMANMRM